MVRAPHPSSCIKETLLYMLASDFGTSDSPLCFRCSFPAGFCKNGVYGTSLYRGVGICTKTLDFESSSDLLASDGQCVVRTLSSLDLYDFGDAPLVAFLL